MSWVRVLLSPRLLVLHVVAALAVGLAAWLGWWQLDAWQDQREDRALELADEAPRPLADVLGSDDPFPGEHVGRPVTVSGSWLDDSTVFVADRRRSADAPAEGAWQVALLSTCPAGGAGCGGAPAIPVVLGWADSTDAGVAAPSGTETVQGWLQPAEQGETDPDPGDDVVPSLRTADLLQRTQADLYSGYVILEQPAAARQGLVAVTPETLPEPPPSTALRNLLYGLEWWVFAAFAAYLWWRWSRDAVADAQRAVAVDQPVASNA